MISFDSLHLVEWLAGGVLVVSLLSALLLGIRERRSRAAAEDLLERADAELEGRLLLDEGWRALRQGAIEGAERLRRGAVRIYQKHGDPALNALLLWLRERRSRVKAGDVLERADAELEGHRLLDEGWQALRQGAIEEAERLLRRAVRLYEELGDPALIGHARYRLAILYRIGGELDRAIRTLKPAVELNSPLPQPYLFLARSYERAGRFDRAEQVLKAARRHCGSPREVNPWLHLLKDEDYRRSVSMDSGKHLAPSLAELPGVGKKTTAALLQMGLEGLPLLANARAEELTVIPHLGEAAAARIIEEARQQLQLGRWRKKESNHV